MKCIRCNATMDDPKRVFVAAEIEGVRLAFGMKAPQCPQCGRVAIRGKDLAEYARLARRAYKKYVIGR